MKKYFFTLSAFVVGLTANSMAQNPMPAPVQKKSILLMNGTAHLGNGQVIQNSAIGIKDGKLTLVADATVIRLQAGAFDTTINIAGKQVYPGFIAPNSTLGLNEIEAVRSTRDFSETGNYNPHVRSIISYNSDSKIVKNDFQNLINIGILVVQQAQQASAIFAH